VPDGGEEIAAALLNVGAHAGMRRIEMPHGAVGVAGEDGDGRVLMTFAVFAAEVVLEGAVAGAQQAQLVPAAGASVGAESGDIGGGYYGEVEILRQVMHDAVGAVEPGGTHRARFVCRLPYIR
jgi:hypothetical protein